MNEGTEVSCGGDEVRGRPVQAGRARRRRLPWIRTIAVLGGAALLAVGCGSSDDSAAAPTPTTAAGVGDAGIPPQPLATRSKLKVTIPAKYETFSSVYLADAFGEFDKENLDVEVVSAQSQDVLPLMQKDEVQVQGCGPSVGTFNAINAGIDLVWAAPNSTPSAPGDETGLWVSNDLLGPDGKVDPEALKDATIGLGNLQLGSSNALPVSQFLDTIGLSLTDLTTSPLNGGDLVAAFQNGAVQAAWFNAPLWQPIGAAGNATLVHPQGDLVLGGYCLGPHRGEHAEELEAFFRALARTNRVYLQGDYHQDPAVVQAISKAIGVTPDIITKTPPLVFDPELELDANVSTDLQTIWLDAGLLTYSPPLTSQQLVDTSLVRSALDS